MATVCEGGEYRVSLCGERVRAGDRLGVVYLASRHAVGFTLNGALMAPPTLLPRDAAIPASPRGRRLHFYARFDCVAGTAARVVRERAAPLDTACLLASAEHYVPRPPEGPPTLLVRTVGPDSYGFVVPLSPEATVAELQEMVLSHLGVDNFHSVELRVTGHACASGTRLLNGPFAQCDPATTRLCDVGLGYEKGSGCQLRDLLVSMPHLIS